MAAKRGTRIRKLVEVAGVTTRARRKKLPGDVVEVTAAIVPVETPALERVLRALAMRYDEGRTYTEARDALMRQFGCNRSTAENDLADARLMLARAFEDALPTLAPELAADYRRIMAKAEAAKDYAAAVASGRALQRLAGLEKPRKVEVTGTVKLTTAGQRGRMQELLEKARAAAEAKRTALGATVIDIEPNQEPEGN